MCFPSKRQKDNFTDAATKEPSNTQNGSDEKDTKAEKDSTPVPANTSTTPLAPVAPSTVPEHSIPDKMSPPRVAIVIYTMFGHIGQMARAVQKGVESAGGKAEIFQVAETLSEEVLGKMKAPHKPEFPVLPPAGLKEYDAYLFGIPTRFGNMPAQWKAFWDQTGGIWFNKELAGRYAGVFVSTDTPGGGQEVTILNFLSTLTHHGIIYVPLGYKDVSDQLMDLEQVHGGSPWGAGTFAGSGTRNPTPLELEVANKQGANFFKIVSRVKFE